MLAAARELLSKSLNTSFPTFNLFLVILYDVWLLSGCIFSSDLTVIEPLFHVNRAVVLDLLVLYVGPVGGRRKEPDARWDGP